MKKIIGILIIFVSLVGCYNPKEEVDKSKLTGMDYRLFQGTPAWPLARAVEAGDTQRIRREVVENKVDPDFQESKYGNTLLMMAILNGQYKSARTLLSVGSDPNLPDKYRGTSAMIDAGENSDPRFLKLLLAYKGNPNAVEERSLKSNTLPRKTALSSTIFYDDPNSLEKVKLLVEAGANVNFPDNDDPDIDLPLGIAVKRDRMDIALYLLEKGADYNRVMYRMIDGREVYILEALRKSTLDLKSVNYQKKLEVIAFLKHKGLDYDREPVPEYIIKDIKKKHPNDWEEYLEKY